jgi:hypothetical protein
MLLVRYILLSTLTTILLMCGRVSAWSESGHHIIAVLAFDQLNEIEQNELLRILAAHPRYDEDFSPPDKIRNVNRWRIGRAGYWPDAGVDRSVSPTASSSESWRADGRLTVMPVHQTNAPARSAPSPIRQCSPG